jgi:bifunctional DNA primase/polymerase-like protein/AAA domain-containing protein/primase-like protein
MRIEGATMSIKIPDAALKYAKRGLPVFPVRGKLPLTVHGFKDASTDADQIRDWWSEWPNANIAIATGAASGLVVLDVDPRHDGDKSLAALEAKFGLLPATLEARTGGGGRHIFFALGNGQNVRNSAGRLGPGLDVRGDGGYIVAPPSIHPETMQPYAWTNRLKPALAPVWLNHELSPPAAICETVSGAPIPAGQRNDTLTRIAGAMRRKGCTPEAIEAALLAENTRRCSPPLPEQEARAIAQSVSRYVPATGANAPGRKPTEQAKKIGGVTRCVADIPPEALRWLWPGRIPLGKLTLLIGDPGLGKSLVTLGMAAAVSRGLEYPDGAVCERGGVLLLSAEDDPSDTIRPRLDAAGADLSRIHILEAIRVPLADGAVTERVFNLEADMGALEDTLERIPDVRLVVIDPLSAYLGGADSHVNAEVRGLLAPLAALASRRSVTVCGVAHLRKSAGAAVHRAIGSIAFAAAARSVWAVAQDPDDPERRLFLPVKQNLAANVGGLAFRVDAPEGRPRVTWESGAVILDANAVLGGYDGGEGQGALREAESWLSDLLASGPVPAKRIQGDAKSAGQTWATVRRAKDSLGIAASKDGYTGGWYWRLPDTEGAQQTSKALTYETGASSAKLSTFEEGEL